MAKKPLSARAIRAASIAFFASHRTPGKITCVYDLIEESKDLCAALYKRLRKWGVLPNGPDVVECLLTVVENKKAKVDVRTAAVKLVGKAGIILHGDRSIRILHVDRLNQGFDAPAMDRVCQVLAGALDDADPHLRHAAIEATGFVLAKVGSARTVRALAACLARETVEDNVLLLLSVLRRFGPDVVSLASDELLGLTTHANENIRMEACQLLVRNEVTSTEIVDSLIRLAKSGGSMAMQKEAVSMLVGIKPPYEQFAQLVDRYDAREAVNNLLAELGKAGRDLRQGLAGHQRSAGKTLNKTHDNSSAEQRPKRPMYDRDHYFMRTRDALEVPQGGRHCRNVMVRDIWNNLSDEERKDICPTDPRQLSTEGVSGQEVVRKGIKLAQEEVGPCPAVVERDNGSQG